VAAKADKSAYEITAPADAFTRLWYKFMKYHPFSSQQKINRNMLN
jgi:hypothetical protein